MGGLDGSGDVDSTGIRQLGVRADGRNIGDIERAAALNRNITIREIQVGNRQLAILLRGTDGKG